MDFKRTERLGALLLDLRRGSQMKASELNALKTTEKTGIRYLEYADFKDGLLDFGDEFLEKLPEGLERFCAKNGDLVMTRMQNPTFKLAVVDCGEETLLAGSNFYILSFDEEKVNPRYVQAFLMSEAGQGLLSAESRGKVLQMISMKNLRSIEIPLPERSEQDAVAESFQGKLEAIERQKKRCLRMKEELQEEVNKQFEMQG